MRTAGPNRSADAGMSNDNLDEKSRRQKPKVSSSKVNPLRVSRPLRRGRKA